MLAAYDRELRDAYSVNQSFLPILMRRIENKGCFEDPALIRAKKHLAELQGREYTEKPRVESRLDGVHSLGQLLCLKTLSNLFTVFISRLIPN